MREFVIMKGYLMIGFKSCDIATIIACFGVYRVFVYSMLSVKMFLCMKNEDNKKNTSPFSPPPKRINSLLTNPFF